MHGGGTFPETVIVDYPFIVCRPRETNVRFFPFLFAANKRKFDRFRVPFAENKREVAVFC
jgi:hypothetical protein